MYHITNIKKTYHVDLKTHFILFCLCRTSNFLSIKILFFDNILKMQNNLNTFVVIFIFIYLFNNKCIIFKIKHYIFDVFSMMTRNLLTMILSLYTVILLKNIVVINLSMLNASLISIDFSDAIAKCLFFDRIKKQFSFL